MLTRRLEEYALGAINNCQKTNGLSGNPEIGRVINQQTVSGKINKAKGIWNTERALKTKSEFQRATSSTGRQRLSYGLLPRETLFQVGQRLASHLKWRTGQLGYSNKRRASFFSHFSTHSNQLIRSSHYRAISLLQSFASQQAVNHLSPSSKPMMSISMLFLLFTHTQIYSARSVIMINVNVSLFSEACSRRLQLRWCSQ